MRTKNKFIVFILSMLSVFFISCGKEVEKIEESKFLFGTYIKIIVYSDNKEKAMQSIEKAFNEIQRIDEKYNSKSEGSLIYNLNNSDNKTVKLDEEGIKLFEGIKKSYELSKHKYDITIAPLLELWGFTDETIELSTLKLPTKEEIDFTKTFVGYDKVNISEDGILTIESPVKEIDTGSFLKGYAISKAKEILKADGIKSAFITSISSIEVIGEKPENKPIEKSEKERAEKKVEENKKAEKTVQIEDKPKTTPKKEKPSLADLKKQISNSQPKTSNGSFSPTADSDGEEIVDRVLQSVTYSNGLVSGSKIGNSEGGLLVDWNDGNRIPEFPQSARASGKHGKLKIKLKVDKAGNILSYVIVEGSGVPEIDASVERVVGAWRVKLLKKGKPVNGTFYLNYNFNFK